jgi:hypothetical protein
MAVRKLINDKRLEEHTQEMKDYIDSLDFATGDSTNFKDEIVTLTLAGWVLDTRDNTYKQILNVDGITKDSNPIIVLRPAGEEATDDELKAYKSVTNVYVGDNTITFNTDKMPVVDLTVIIKSVIASGSTGGSGNVNTHNINAEAHNDIRLLIAELSNRLNALANSDDTTLDQLSEIVSYIKSDSSLIDAITTSKVSVTDIIDNLTTNATDKVLAASQGVVIKTLIDALEDSLNTTNQNITNINNAINELNILLYGDEYAKEKNVISCGGIELFPNDTSEGKAYIDFHFGNNIGDNTHRIIANTEDTLESSTDLIAPDFVLNGGVTLRNMYVTHPYHMADDGSTYHSCMEARDNDTLNRIQIDSDGVCRKYTSIDNGVTWTSTEMVESTAFNTLSATVEKSN